MSKRLWNLIGILVIAAVLLGACQPTPTPTEEFAFGVILVGPYNDHGWSEAHYTAAEYVTEKLPNTSFVYLDKLNPADRPETTLEQAVDDMVSQGAKVVFTTSDDFKEDTDLAAKKYPDVTFIHISGDHVLTGDAPPNVDNYMGKMPYGKMMAGCAAALATESGTIGYVGPLINDETRRLASSVYLGARYCYENYRGMNPDDLRVIVTWIGFWFNIPGVTLDPTEVSNDLINEGTDVLASGIDTTEAVVVAKQKKQEGKAVWAIPYDYIGACEGASEVCLGVPYFNWGPSYVDFMKEAFSGKWKPKWVWLGPDWKDINNPDTSNVGFVAGAALPASAKKELDGFIKALGSGKINLFKGPLNYQDGTPFVKAGQSASDKQVWYMEQLLQGIDGQSSAK